MRLNSLLLCGLTFWAISAFAAPNSEETAATEPEIHAIASFPEENQFGHVINGEQNKIILAVENLSDLNVTLTRIGGSFIDLDKDTVIRNTSIAKVETLLPSGEKVKLLYTFHSEFKPGDLRLKIWVEHITSNGAAHQVIAYDSPVTIVEPEISFFDFKMLTTWLILLIFFGGVFYVAYRTFLPPPKKQRTKRVDTTSGDPVTVTASGATYQESWIPEHHLRRGGSQSRRGQASGNEPDSDETSGTEKKKASSKKPHRT